MEKENDYTVAQIQKAITSRNVVAFTNLTGGTKYKYLLPGGLKSMLAWCKRADHACQELRFFKTGASSQSAAVSYELRKEFVESVSLGIQVRVFYSPGA